MFLTVLEDFFVKNVKKLKHNKKIQDKKFLEDALLTSIAGISAAMKNTG